MHIIIPHKASFHNNFRIFTFQVECVVSFQNKHKPNLVERKTNGTESLLLGKLTIQSRV